MNEHQRRVWARMTESVDDYRAGQLGLRKLVNDLQGLMGAADIHDQAIIDEFWNHKAPIDMQLELRSEDWAPPGAASDEALDQALTDFRRWATEVLDWTDDERT